MINKLPDDKIAFPLAIQSGVYGYKTTNGTFVAFRGDSTDTYTYASGSTGSTVDMGARNNYRYVNATNVYNKGKADGVTVHTSTYTFPSNDTGGQKDLGASHTYRYINATNVYNKGKSDGTKNWIEYTIGSSGLTLNLKQGDRLIWRGATTDWISVNGQRCDYGDGGYSFTVQGWTLEKAYCEPGSTWKSCFVCTVNTTGSYSMTGNNSKFLYLPA